MCGTRMPQTRLRRKSCILIEMIQPAMIARFCYLDGKSGHYNTSNFKWEVDQKEFEWGKVRL